MLFRDLTLRWTARRCCGPQRLGANHPSAHHPHGLETPTAAGRVQGAGRCECGVPGGSFPLPADGGAECAVGAAMTGRKRPSGQDPALGWAGRGRALALPGPEAEWRGQKRRTALLRPSGHRGDTLLLDEPFFIGMDPVAVQASIAPAAGAGGGPSGAVGHPRPVPPSTHWAGRWCWSCRSWHSWCGYCKIPQTKDYTRAIVSSANGCMLRILNLKRRFFSKKLWLVLPFWSAKAKARPDGFAPMIARNDDSWFRPFHRQKFYRGAPGGPA